MQIWLRRAAVVTTAGAVAGIVAVTLAISYATLVFRGDLEPLAPTGVGLALFGSLAIGLVSASTSGFAANIAGPQGPTAVIIGIAAATIATTATADTVLDTIIAFIIVAALTTGISLYCLGRFGVGGLVRFLPFPVIGGYLGGAGVLVIRSMIEVVLRGNGLGGALDGDTVALWAPSLVFGLVLAVVFRRGFAPHVVTPLLIVGSIVIFHIVLAVAGISRAEAAERGWTLGPFPDGSLWPADAALSLGRADWSIIGGQAASIAAILVVSTVSVLLQITGMETELNVEVDVDAELRSVGLSNVAAGFGGGFPGYMYLSDSTIVSRMTTPIRPVAFVSVGVVVLAMVAGADFVALVPIVVSAGVLFFIGLLFSLEWIWDARKRLSRPDHLLVLAIVASIAILGFLTGLAVGVVVAIVLFVVRYSRTDVIRHQMDIRQRRSNVARSHDQGAWLSEHGGEVVIYALQGFVFFGTADRILEAIRARLAQDEPLTEVFLDFRRVTGADSSVAVTFAKIARLGEAEGFTVNFTSMTDRVRTQLGEHLGLADTLGIVNWSDLDRGLEAAERRILDRLPAAIEDGSSVPASLAQVLGPDSALSRHLQEAPRIELVDGQLLLTQGEPSSGLYFLEQGRLVVHGDAATGGADVRQRLLEAGAMVGEMGWYLESPNTRTVSADGPCRIVHLDPDELQELVVDHPEVHSDLQLFVVRTLAERLGHANDVIQHLLR